MEKSQLTNLMVKAWSLSPWDQEQHKAVCSHHFYLTLLEFLDHSFSNQYVDILGLINFCWLAHALLYVSSIPGFSALDSGSTYINQNFFQVLPNDSWGETKWLPVQNHSSRKCIVRKTGKEKKERENKSERKK